MATYPRAFVAILSHGTSNFLVFASPASKDGLQMLAWSAQHSLESSLLHQSQESQLRFPQPVRIARLLLLSEVVYLFRAQLY